MSGFAFSLDAQVFTTGQVAKICRVSPKLVSKWFDAGTLRGYRIPGSQDRRIPRAALIAFLDKHGITDALHRLESSTSCLLAGVSPHLEQRLHELMPDTPFVVARCLFDAGVAMAHRLPLAVVDVTLGPSDQVRHVIERLAGECNRVIVLLPEDSPAYLEQPYPGAKALLHLCAAEQIVALLGEEK